MIYRTLKTRKRKENAIDLPNRDDLNDYFVSIGPNLSAKFNNKKSSFNIRKNDTTMVLHQTNESGVAKNLEESEKQEKHRSRWNLKRIFEVLFFVIECHLARAINFCLLERIFPES